MDRNAPKFEPWRGEPVWWPHDSMALFGAEARDDLRNVYVDCLTQRPEERGFLDMVRPDRPSAISFIRGKPSKVPCRYDVVYASPEFDVLDVRYVYEDAIRAGRDYRLVWARLHLGT